MNLTTPSRLNCIQEFSEQSERRSLSGLWSVQLNAKYVTGLQSEAMAACSCSTKHAATSLKSNYAPGVTTSTWPEYLYTTGGVETRLTVNLCVSVVIPRKKQEALKPGENYVRDVDH